MKRFICKIGFHKYNRIGEQSSINLINIGNGVYLSRIIHICELCGKIKYTSYDVGINRKILYNDSKLWKPKIDLSLEYRKVKINVLQRRIRKIK